MGNKSSRYNDPNKAKGKKGGEYQSKYLIIDD
jgi:hypothetical protein